MQYSGNGRNENDLLGKSSRTDSALIPINLVIDSESIIKCGVSEDPAPIADEIKEGFSDFASGKVGDGVAKVLSSGLKLLFGQYLANSAETTRYLIGCGDLGGVYRLDIHMFSYQYTSEQLTSVTKNVLAVSIVMSSVDTAKIDDNTLLIIVQKCYASCTTEEQRAIYDQIKQHKSSPNPPAPLHVVRRSLKLGAARSNGHLRGLASAPPAPNNLPKVVAQKSTASVLLTFKIGTASQSADAIKGYVTGALVTGHTFQKNLLVTTSPQDDDLADQFLVMSVVAERYAFDSDARRAARHEPPELLLIRKLSDCLFDLRDDDMPVIAMQAYQFLLGTDDDTPRESSLKKLTAP
ncbi:hypothetical protein FHL15_010309 [Xylaria flabelliformis]|uniref:Uncharacterized protein n=1 Tax=Xylaria flabelliformis TaxID=2512241 RepID=A0A553HLL5_9PEZI|nr:hypothetical protein FHL15_010309 [Xylaria flabelliformis]